MALDPLPELFAAGMIGLTSMSRERFVNGIIHGLHNDRAYIQEYLANYL